MGVIEDFFQFLANGIMDMLWALRDFLVRDALKIKPPTERIELVSGYYYNLEIFPILFALTILVGIVSLPFARQRVTMEVFLLKMLKVFLFVGLIGVILTGAVELNNAIVDFMWPKGEYENMMIRLNGTLEGMMSTAALAIAVAVLGSLSWFTYAIFFLALYLRAFLVHSLYILSPFLGAFLFLDFGPFKSASRMPKILIRATAYMLMAGVIAAGFAQVGIAVGGGFSEEDIDNRGSLDELNVDTVEDLETESYIAEMDSGVGIGGLQPDQIQKAQSRYGSLSGLYQTDADSFTRAPPSEMKHMLYDHPELADEDGNPLFEGDRVHRAVFTCGSAYNGNIEKKHTATDPITGSFNGVSNAAKQAILGDSQQQTYYDMVWEWHTRISEEGQEEITTDSLASCSRMLLDEGIGGWEEHPGIVRVSPVSPKQALEQCDESDRTYDAEKFLNFHEDCVEQMEEKRVGDYEEWRTTPPKPGPVYYWEETFSTERRGALHRYQRWNLLTRTSGMFLDGAGNALNDLTGGVIGAVGQIGRAPEGTFNYESTFEMLGEDGSGMDGECMAGGNAVKCVGDATFSDGFNIFMMWIMSFFAPIIIMFYSGYAAIGPGMMMMRGGAGGGGGASPKGRQASGGDDSSEVLEGGTSEGLDGTDPINPGPSSSPESGSNPGGLPGAGGSGSSPDPHDEPTVDPINPNPGPGGSGGSSSDPITADDGFSLEDTARGAAARANAAQKEIRRQGMGGSPLSWARAGAGHYKQNPPGDPPGADSQDDLTNEEILDQYESFDELEEASAEDLQHEDTEGGAAFNPAEDELVFYEADNNDEVSGQAGTLRGVDDDGNIVEYPWESKEGRPNLEDGEAYNMEGLVAREGSVQKHHGGEASEASWNTEHNTVTPGVQSDITQLTDGDDFSQNTINNDKQGPNGDSGPDPYDGDDPDSGNDEMPDSADDAGPNPSHGGFPSTRETAELDEIADNPGAFEGKAVDIEDVKFEETGRTDLDPRDDSEEIVQEGRLVDQDGNEIAAASYNVTSNGTELEDGERYDISDTTVSRSDGSGPNSNGGPGLQISEKSSAQRVTPSSGDDSSGQKQNSRDTVPDSTPSPEAEATGGNNSQINDGTGGDDTSDTWSGSDRSEFYGSDDVKQEKKESVHQAEQELDALRPERSEAVDEGMAQRYKNQYDANGEAAAKRDAWGHQSAETSQDAVPDDSAASGTEQIDSQSDSPDSTNPQERGAVPDQPLDEMDSTGQDAVPDDSAASRTEQIDSQSDTTDSTNPQERGAVPDQPLDEMDSTDQVDEVRNTGGTDSRRATDRASNTPYDPADQGPEARGGRPESTENVHSSGTADETPNKDPDVEDTTRPVGSEDLNETVDESRDSQIDD